MTAFLIFLRANWKYIISAALVVLVVYLINNYLDSVYNEGRQSGIDDTTAEWSAKYKKDVDALNKKITLIEDQSKFNAELAKIELETANGKISALQEELKKQRSKYDSYVYDHSGKVVCKTDGPIFLGPDFSAKWNEINSQIVK